MPLVDDNASRGPDGARETRILMLSHANKAWRPDTQAGHPALRGRALDRPVHVSSVRLPVHMAEPIGRRPGLPSGLSGLSVSTVRSALRRRSQWPTKIL